MNTTKISLGNLEKDIMRVLWKVEQATVREVLEQLQKKRDIAYTTVMTVMTRLCEKKILRRTRCETGAYCYTSVESKRGFQKKRSENAIRLLLRECGEVAVAQFIDAVEQSNSKELAVWRKKLKNIKE